MSVYADLVEADVLSLLTPLVDQNLVKFNAEDGGKLRPLLRVSLSSPWVIVFHPDVKPLCCGFNFGFLFPAILSKMKLVPSECFGCWKVVARPKTLKQLWGIYEYQKKGDFYAKCGTEERPQVHDNYGAYWYTFSKEEGRDRHQHLKGVPALKDIPIILKRGCSEYEWMCGPSDNWKIAPGQLELEQKVRDLLVMECFEQNTIHEHVNTRVRRRWIEKALSIGDRTAFEFTDGVSPFTKPYREYQ